MRDYANRDLHCPVHFHGAVVEAVRRARPLAQVRGVTFLAPPPTDNGDAVIEVLGDPVLLQEMVEHLVCFSLRFSPDGACVELDVRVRGDSMVLHVRDRGPVGAAGRLDSATELHEVLPRERRSVGGGLGISIARQLTEFHRGTMTIRDRANGGCECAVTLPRWLPARVPAAKSVPPTSGVESRRNGQGSYARAVPTRRS
jgi:signal transduction histidine kinase